MKKILQFNHVTKKYGSRTVLDDLSMTLYEKDFYALIGKNGSGKTELLRMAAGFSRPTDGCLLLFGSRDLIPQRKEMGTLVGAPALYPHLTATENLMVQCRLLSVSDAAARIPLVMSMTGLPDTGRKKVKDFSYGMQKRLAVASALLSFPRLLVLDEPEEGIDQKGVRILQELLLRLNQKYHITILLSTSHTYGLPGLASRYGILHEGRLIEEFTDNQLWEQCPENTVPETCLENYLEKQVRMDMQKNMQKRKENLHDSSDTK